MATVVRERRPARNQPASNTIRVALSYEPLRLCPSVVVATEVAEVSVEGYALGEYELAFARLHRRAYDVAFQLLGYRAEAEDVAQEALARAFIHWPKVHSYAEPWVVRVAGNLAIGSWRKNRRLTSLPDTDAEGDQRRRGARPPAASDVDGAAHNLSDHLELRRALARLSRRQREVVILRHLAGYSERETATTLGCSSGTVKQHSSRGLAALRLVLDIDLTDDPEATDRGVDAPVARPARDDAGDPAPVTPSGRARAKVAGDTNGRSEEGS